MKTCTADVKTKCCDVVRASARKQRELRLTACSIVVSLSVLTAHAAGRIDTTYDFPQGLPNVREALLVLRPGKSVRRYELTGGHGFNFRKEGQPAFNLEFRKGRVDVIWSVFSNPPGKFDRENADVIQVTSAVLSTSLGQTLAGQVMNYVQHKQVAVIKSTSHTVQVSPGEMQNVVTIEQQGLNTH